MALGVENYYLTKTHSASIEPHHSFIIVHCIITEALMYKEHFMSYLVDEQLS